MHVTSPDDLYVAPLGRDVAQGEEVEVEPDLGKQLVAQGWKSRQQKAAKKAARKRTSTKRSTSGDSKPTAPASAGRDVSDVATPDATTAPDTASEATTTEV